MSSSSLLNRIPRDIVNIIYRFVHSDTYYMVRIEYNTKYMPKWDDYYYYFQNSPLPASGRYAVASWRLCIKGSYQNMHNGTNILDMLNSEICGPSRRGGTYGKLSKNY